MPSTKRPGKKSLYIELPEELDNALRTHCEKRGVKIADEVRMAIRRHLANPAEPPPLPPIPPLPPFPPPSTSTGSQPAEKGKPRKGKK